MIRDAEAKCAQMMSQAQMAAQTMPRTVPAQAVAQNDALIAAESARVEEARRTANTRINEIQDQMRSCIQALERIKSANPAPEAPKPAPAKSAGMEYDSDAVADEISQNLEALVGTTVDTAPKAAPKHPVNEATTNRFSSLNLQFGRNYDPTQR